MNDNAVLPVTPIAAHHDALPVSGYVAPVARCDQDGCSGFAAVTYTDDAPTPRIWRRCPDHEATDPVLHRCPQCSYASTDEDRYDAHAATHTEENA